MTEIKYSNDGIRLPDVEIYLDIIETNFLKEFIDSGVSYPTGRELRIITKELGGEIDFENRDNTRYDTLNIPYKNGVLIIERPWVNLRDNNYNGHKIGFYGNASLENLENSIMKYIKYLHTKEIKLAREDFLKQEVESTDDKYWIKRIKKIFNTNLI